MYRFIFRHLFQNGPRSCAHACAPRITIAGRIPVISHGVQRALAGYLTDPTLESRRVSFAGRSVPAPFGLAGGFDKDARAVLGLTMLGFGFVEIGTVTAVAQPGNDKPRVWRELDDQALRNRMGFNNVGAAQVARILSRLRSTRRGRAVFLG